MKLTRILALALLATTSTCGHADEPAYHVSQIQPLDNGQHWDYLAYDADHHHLFIAHGDHADVYDTLSHQLVGRIDHTSGIHGIAFVPRLDLGFTSNGKRNDVTAFRLSTLKTVTSIPTEGNPDAILYDPASGHIVTANGKGRSLTIIDPQSLRNIGNIQMDARPEYTIADGKGSLFTNAEDKNQIIQTDSLHGKVLHRYSMTGTCDAPSGLAYDPATRHLFSVCQNHVMVVMDAQTGKIVQTLSIGDDPDAAIHDHQHHLVFSSNGGSGTLTVIGERNGRYEVRQTVRTAPGARTMALDETSGKIYLVTRSKQTPNDEKGATDGFELITVSP